METAGATGTTGDASATATSTGAGGEISIETLAIGDSILEWNIDEGQSIPEVWGELAGLEVDNAAVGGTMILGGEESIPSQYSQSPGDWGRVLIDGGGNDVGPDGCGCGDCMGVVDEIINAEASAGAMVALVDQITGDGARVVLLGYYMIPPESEFAGCEEEITALNARYAALAAARPMVQYVGAGDVVDYTLDPGLLDDDLIHPSIEGSQVIGAYLAAQVNNVGG